MTGLLLALGIETEDVLVQPESWATPAYAKPHFEDRERNRFDFGNFNRLSPETARSMLARCRACIPHADVVIVNQQVRQGIHTPEIRSALSELIAEFLKDLPGRQPALRLLLRRRAQEAE